MGVGVAFIVAVGWLLGHAGQRTGHRLTVGQPIASTAATLPPGMAEAARERGPARDMQATLRELIEELREEV